MTAKIYNCEALFLVKMENTLLNHRLVEGVGCDNGLTVKNTTRFYVNISKIDRVIVLDYSYELFQTYEERLLAFFKDVFKILSQCEVEETIED